MINGVDIFDEEDILNKKFEYREDFKNIQVSRYKMEDGIKAVLLSCFEQIKNIINNENPNIYHVEINIKDICKYTSIENISELEEIKKLYINECTKILRLLNLSSLQWINYKRKVIVSANKLTNEDYTLLRCIRALTYSFLKEINYVIAKDNVVEHYYLSKVFINVAIELLENTKKYISSNFNIPVINIWLQNNLFLNKFEVKNEDTNKNHELVQKPKIFICK